MFNGPPNGAAISPEVIRAIVDMTVRELLTEILAGAQDADRIKGRVKMLDYLLSTEKPTQQKLAKELGGISTPAVNQGLSRYDAVMIRLREKVISTYGKS